MSEMLVRVVGGAPRPVRNVLRMVRTLFFICQRSIAKCFGQRVAPAFWADALNFGDQITPALLRSYGVVPKHTQCVDAHPPVNTLVSCGSILGWIGDDYDGYVLGSGLAMRQETKPMPHARFLGVRGALTRDAMGLDGSVLLGDPGLLSERLLGTKPNAKRIFLGIVPQQLDLGSGAVNDFAEALQRQAVRKGKVVKIINSRCTPRTVVKDIASCEYVVSSSLHGLIVADAFGIPNARVRIDKVIGDFKFADYYSAYDEELGETYDVHPGMDLDEVVGFCRFPEERGLRIAQIKRDLNAAYLKYICEAL